MSLFASACEGLSEEEIYDIECDEVFEQVKD